MTAYREQINFHVVHVDVHLAHSLSGVGVEEYLPGPAHFSYLLHRLHDSNLVIHHHDRYERCVWSHRFLKLLQNYMSIVTKDQNDFSNYE